MKYLLDASALLPLIRNIKNREIWKMEEFAILDLTVYEIGNALWKEIFLKRKERLANVNRDLLDKAIKGFSKIIFHLKVLNLTEDDFSKVLNKAIELNLTYYDASYVYTAEKENLTLITEDKEILKKFNKAIPVKKLKS